MARRLEDGLQKLCFQWLTLARPDVYAFAIPNEAKRSPRTAGRMRAMGLTAGVADICILAPPNCGIAGPGFIELKIRPNKLTEPQEAFRDECMRRGVPWAECTSFEEFQGVIRAWCGHRFSRVA